MSPQNVPAAIRKRPFNDLEVCLISHCEARVTVRRSFGDDSLTE
jgi:hypothetical protein